jgi:CRP/FNR family transcriptional regulator, anaerobic regulatory protein
MFVLTQADQATLPKPFPVEPKMALAAERSAPVKRAMARCSACARRMLCLPADLSSQETEAIEEVVQETRTIARGVPLYRASDRFHNFYAVRTGSFKSVIVHHEGFEQINSFFVAGETLGLDGLGDGSHAADAVALEDSSVCVIPFAKLESLCRESRTLQRHVHRVMSGEIVRHGKLLMQIGTMKAERRVAAFLLNLSERLGRRGYPTDELELRMSREEVGNYLGLKLETVSRMLTKLTRQGLVEIRAKKVRIINFEALAQI